MPAFDKLCPECDQWFEAGDSTYDRHIIQHLADGKWPNANNSMVREAICRALVRLGCGLPDSVSKEDWVAGQSVATPTATHDAG